MKKIVITGGPCAGKTTVIETLRKSLSCHFVNEVATTLFEEGYPPPDPWTQDWQNQFQKAIFDRQIQVELLSTQGITIFDRGLGDGAAYDPNFWTRFNITKEDIWSRYDRVIILRSLAFLDPEKYTELQRTNPHRFESPERALELDQKILNIYQDHPNAYISDGNLETTISHIKEIVR